MGNTFFRFYRRIVKVLSIPVILHDFFQRETGEEYNLKYFNKVKLFLKIYKNSKKIQSSTSYLEHLVMATKILKIPKSLEGCVVECGCFKGASTTSLSLVCKLVGRKLEVFDSFQGLPKPSEDDKNHVVLSQGEVHIYKEGTWHGNLEEVKRNISKFGCIEVCDFNAGYFNETLPHFKKKCVFAFTDVDLVDSLRTCLLYLWPLLENNGILFTHEASHLDIAFLFFNKDWWEEKLNSKPPGLIGAGSGLGIIPRENFFASSLGYTVKNPHLSGMKKILPIGKK